VFSVFLFFECQWFPVRRWLRARTRPRMTTVSGHRRDQVRCLSWVKRRNTRREQMFSALAPITDIAQYGRHVRWCDRRLSAPETRPTTRPQFCPKERARAPLPLQSQPVAAVPRWRQRCGLRRLPTTTGSRRRRRPMASNMRNGCRPRRGARYRHDDAH
jgi:hypothetical protein